MKNINRLLKLATEFAQKLQPSLYDPSEKVSSVLREVLSKPPFVDYVWDQVVERTEDYDIIYIDLANSSETSIEPSLSKAEVIQLVASLAKLLKLKFHKATFNLTPSKTPVGAGDDFYSLELKVIVPKESGVK